MGEQQGVTSVNYHIFEDGTTEQILELLQSHINVTWTSTNGGTALHSVLRNEKLTERDIVKFVTILLIRGVDPNKEGRFGETALHLAIERRIKEAIRRLLRSEADRSNGYAHFFMSDELGKKTAMLYSLPPMTTPEMLKVTEKRGKDFLQFLLEEGFDFDHENEEGKTPLHLAIEYSLPHLLPVLLDRINMEAVDDLTKHLLLDVSINSQLKHDSTLLLLLNKTLNSQSRQLITLFNESEDSMNKLNIIINDYLSKCDNANIATNLFENLVSTCTWWSDADRDYFTMVLKDMIRTHGVMVNEEETKKRLLETAFKTKSIWLYDFFVEIGMNSINNLEMENGKNLFSVVAEQVFNNDVSSFEFCRKFVQLLYGCGYDFNSEDRRGKTALETAIDFVNLPMVCTLIDFANIDVNHRDRYRRTALHRALIVGFPNHSTALEPFRKYKAAQHRGLLHRMEDPNYLRWSPISRSSATQDQMRAIVSFLLAKHPAKPSFDVNARDAMNNTPLHIAIFHGDMQIFKMLVCNNANVNAKNKEGNTPLQLILTLAKSEFNKDMITLLLNRGACPNVKNERLETPLELAFLFHPELANELLKFNADMNDPYTDHMVRDLLEDEVDPQGDQNLESTTLRFLRRHFMKLMAADLPISSQYRNYMVKRIDENYYNQCSAEVKKLKKVMIDEQKSLYDFIHMHPRARLTYLERENLQQIVESPDLMNEFPEIIVLVLASYQEAKSLQKRETISVVVSEIFLKRYNEIHEEIAENIMNFMSDEDLLS